MARFPDFKHEQQVVRRPHHVAPDMSSIRVIFVIHTKVPKQPGSDSGLGITINCTMRVLRKYGIHAEGWSIQTVEQLFHRLEKDQWSSNRPITHVVVNTTNFVTPVQFGELAQRWFDIEFVMLCHTGLAYLSIDDNGPQRIRGLLHLERSAHNIKVAGNNPRFEWFGIYGVEPLLLPNLYDTDTFVELVGNRQDHDPLRIGSFGENRPWKNQSVAAMAAMSIARKMGVQLELYVNADRWPQSMPLSRAREELLANLPWAKLKRVHWAPWSHFREIVSTMDILLNPSFDETFCMVCADGIAEGVPGVVTGALEWAPRSWQATQPEDPASIANIGLAMLHNRASAVADGRKALRSFVKQGTGLWLEYLVA
jgi:glycosyltransferase involved in cell wall biosynthesis